MFRASVVAVTLILTAACDDTLNLYFYDAHVVETDFQSGAVVAFDVSFNGEGKKRLSCRLKYSMLPASNNFTPGYRIKLIRSSKWAYDADTFCGILNQAEITEVFPQSL